MEPFSDTESEPEQFPQTPPVEEQSLEKKPKRTYKKKVKVQENEVVEDTPKPKRVLSDEQKQKMLEARRKKIAERKAEREALSKPEPLTREVTEVIEEPTEVEKPKRKYTRKPKAEPEEKKEKVVEIHHHHYKEEKEEPKKRGRKPKTEPKEPKAEPVKRMPRVKPVVQTIDFV